MSWMKEIKSLKHLWTLDGWKIGFSKRKEVGSESHSVMSDFATVYGIVQARILEWVAMHSSRGSSQSRDWTQVSCLADGFFTSWAPRFGWLKEGLNWSALHHCTTVSPWELTPGLAALLRKWLVTCCLALLGPDCRTRWAHRGSPAEALSLGHPVSDKGAGLGWFSVWPRKETSCFRLTYLKEELPHLFTSKVPFLLIPYNLVWTLCLKMFYLQIGCICWVTINFPVKK